MRRKLLLLGKRVVGHELVRGSSLIFIGSTVANFFAFFFNFFLVRAISSSQYGEYAALLSLITLAGIPAQSILPVIVRFATNYLAKKEQGKAAQFYLHTTRAIAVAAIIVFLGFVIFSHPLATFLHIRTSSFLIVVGLIVAAMYLVVPNNAFLQSEVKFGFLAGTTTLGGAIKLGVGVIFVFLGWQVGGVLWAFLLSFLLPYVVTFFPLRNLLFLHATKREEVAIKEIIAYALPTIVTFFALSAFTSTDVLLVKHYFPSHLAGLYAGLSLLGRIIFYFTAPIAMVMFPMVIKSHEENRNFQNLFYVAILLVLLPSFLIASAYFVLPMLMVHILLGKGYDTIAPFLGWFGVYIGIFSILNVVVNFLLSLKKTKVAYVVGLGAISQALLIVFFHQNFQEVIAVSVGINLLLLLILLLYYIKEYGTTKTA